MSTDPTPTSRAADVLGEHQRIVATGACWCGAWPVTGARTTWMEHVAQSLADAGMLREQDAAAVPPRAASGELLTPDEHAAVTLAGELWGLLCRVVENGPSRGADLAELVPHIHAIQHAVMAQAAARRYPDRYRRLGSTLSCLVPTVEHILAARGGTAAAGDEGLRDALDHIVTTLERSERVPLWRLAEARAALDATPAPTEDPAPAQDTHECPVDRLCDGWPFGVDDAYRTIAAVAWPAERVENRDGWAVTMRHRPDLFEQEAARARERLDAAIAHGRAALAATSPEAGA